MNLSFLSVRNVAWALCLHLSRRRGCARAESWMAGRARQASLYLSRFTDQSRRSGRGGECARGSTGAVIISPWISHPFQDGTSQTLFSPDQALKVFVSQAWNSPPRTCVVGSGARTGKGVPLTILREQPYPCFTLLKQRRAPMPLPTPRKQPALEDAAPGIARAQDLDLNLDDRGSSSAGNSNGNAEESDDDDGAIARLFSIGGIKRRRRSDNHQDTNGREAVRTRPKQPQRRRFWACMQHVLFVTHTK